MLILCPWRAGCHLLFENNCLHISNTNFNKEIVDHIVAMVQDFVTLLSRTELFRDWFSFLATGIRLNVYLVQGFFLNIYSALGFGLLLRTSYHGLVMLPWWTKPFRWISLLPFYTFVAALNGISDITAITFQVTSKLISTFSVFYHTVYTSLSYSNITQIKLRLPSLHASE